MNIDVIVHMVEYAWIVDAITYTQMNSPSEAFKNGIMCQSKLGVCATMQRIKGLEEQKFSMEKKEF